MLTSLVLLVTLWAIGVATTYTLRGAIHLLLVFAVVLIVMHVSRRRVA
ncbi:MAG: lmo0937 family membrane protein [Vicinamibacterales bacterium]